MAIQSAVELIGSIDNLQINIIVKLQGTNLSK